MNRPKRFIRHELTSPHYDVGVLVIGKTIIPVAILIVLYGLTTAGLFIWGIVGSSIAGWESFGAFAPFGICVGLAVCSGVITLLAILARWIKETFKDANERGLD